MNQQTKKLTLAAMFAALAVVAVAVGRVPVVLFLKYDPKDIFITLSGLILGPLYAFAVTLVSSIIEMLILSDTGVIGLVMNIVSSCAFALPVAIIYKKKKSLKGAGIGLLIGVVTMVVVMLIWNYAITPLYMGVARADVAAMLIPYFLPFNLIKGGLNAAITFLLYKPVIGALRRAHLVPESGGKKGKANIPLIVVSLAIIVTSVLFILSFNGVI